LSKTFCRPAAFKRTSCGDHYGDNNDAENPYRQNETLDVIIFVSGGDLRRTQLPIMTCHIIALHPWASSSQHIIVIARLLPRSTVLLFCTPLGDMVLNIMHSSSAMLLSWPIGALPRRRFSSLGGREKFIDNCKPAQSNIKPPVSAACRMRCYVC
jgi:hypothetical protein